MKPRKKLPRNLTSKERGSEKDERSCSFLRGVEWGRVRQEKKRVEVQEQEETRESTTARRSARKPRGGYGRSRRQAGKPPATLFALPSARGLAVVLPTPSDHEGGDPVPEVSSGGSLPPERWRCSEGGSQPGLFLVAGTAPSFRDRVRRWEVMTPQGLGSPFLLTCEATVY